ncbi:hypothetical protein [Tahibacter aquaticus]|uniref:hypothetical protein n=1 Tax=Tahibacter aquaticus TaxID=520092 RepID=UPI001FB7D9BE|nr:hypothetical protein [Tahibacter aquaticus]
MALRQQFVEDECDLRLALAADRVSEIGEANRPAFAVPHDARADAATLVGRGRVGKYALLAPAVLVAERCRRRALALHGGIDRAPRFRRRV